MYQVAKAPEHIVDGGSGEPCLSLRRTRFPSDGYYIVLGSRTRYTEIEMISPNTVCVVPYCKTQV